MKFIIVFTFACLIFVSSATPKLSKHDVGELLLGILEGIIDDVPDIGPCLEDSGYDVEDIIKAVEDMRAGGAGNIAKGLKEIYDALATLPAIFKNCSGAIEEVEQLEAIFSSPYTFIMHSLRDILVNGINIADNLEAVFQDYDNQQWKQMGFQIGDMLEEIFIGGKSQEVQKLFDSSDVEQFLIGVLEGLVVDVPDIGPCIEDSGFDLEDIISAIEDIRSGIDDKSASEIGAGLEEIYKALKMLPSIYKDCSDAPEEIEKLEEIFSSPYTFAFHTVYDIIVNGIDIADEIEAMIQDYDNQEWKAMGFQVGDCLDKIFLGGEKNLVANSPKLSKHDVGELLLGILEGIIDDVPDIGPCLEDSGYDVEDIIKAVEDMRAGGPANIAKGLKEIYDALATLPAIFKNCSGAIEEVEQLEAIFSSPYTFIMHSLRDILVNGINIADNLEAIFQDYDNQQWKQMGFQIGDMLEEIFIGGKSQVSNETPKLSKHDVGELLLGILEGIIDDVPDIGPCLEDSGYDVEDIIKAVEDMRAGGAGNIAKGLKEIYDALATLPAIFKNCSGAIEEVEQLEAIFSSPYTFIMHSLRDILVNGINIADNLEAIFQDYDNQQWKQMGFQIGDMLEEIFIGGKAQQIFNQ